VRSARLERRSTRAEIVAALEAIRRDILATGAGHGLVGPPVVGLPVPSRIFLLGQAPGPHEARFGRPFAWTAGKTLFKWLGQATGADEETVRRKVYIAAVVRAFPGKTKAGGDRVPSPEEIAVGRRFIEREIQALRPRLVLPIGRLAIGEVLGVEQPLAEVIGKQLRVRYHGVEVDVICLPHPSGASTWFKREPGKALLTRALRLIARHPEIHRALGAKPGK
jgi:uracil-DNA glycosylase